MARSYKEDYYGFMNGDMVLPFNVFSSSVLNPGADKYISDNYVQGVIFTNLHEDTYGRLNDVGFQGPFTDTWVGGHQHRHVDLNRYDANLIDEDTGLPTPNNLQSELTRPEAWQLLLGDYIATSTTSSDGAFGFVGADYGGPYPDTTRQMAVHYRGDRAKRPLNIANINYTTASVRLGNYTNNYEIVHTVGRTANNIKFRRLADCHPTQLLQPL